MSVKIVRADIEKFLFFNFIILSYLDIWQVKLFTVIAILTFSILLHYSLCLTSCYSQKFDFFPTFFVKSYVTTSLSHISIISSCSIRFTLYVLLSLSAQLSSCGKTSLRPLLLNSFLSGH